MPQISLVYSYFSKESKSHNFRGSLSSANQPSVLGYGLGLFPDCSPKVKEKILNGTTPSPFNTHFFFFYFILEMLKKNMENTDMKTN